MATTNLIVDFLVIGSSCLSWLIPLMYLISPQTADSLVQLSPTEVIPILGVVYILGIAMNRLADDIFSYWDKRIVRDVFGESPVVPYQKQLNHVVWESETASDYLNYRRGIVRISRASTLNFSLSAVFWLILTWLPGNPYRIGETLWVFVFSAFLALLLNRTWRATIKGYYQAIKNFYELSGERKSEESSVHAK